MSIGNCECYAAEISLKCDSSCVSCGLHVYLCCRLSGKYGVALCYLSVWWNDVILIMFVKGIKQRIFHQITYILSCIFA